MRDPLKELFNVEHFDYIHEPYNFGKIDIANFPLQRKLNYLVKHNHSSDFEYGHMFPLSSLIHGTMNILEDFGIDVWSHYCYVTFDSGMVWNGSSQRSPGWHIDGMQGEEVKDKKPGDFTFTWCDSLPTEYVLKKFFMEGFDATKRNLFTWLDKQIDYKDEIFSIPTKTLIGMDSYTVHRGKIRDKSDITNGGHRRFIRIGWTRIPITSKKMSINPHMNYKYDIHTTSGEIPSKLV